MTSLLVWMLLAYGISNILVYGKIFNGPRTAIQKWAANDNMPFYWVGEFIANMLDCMMCTSVWVGFFLGIFLYSPVSQHLTVNPFFSWFFDGLFASGTVWTINSVIEWFEQNRPSNNE